MKSVVHGNEDLANQYGERSKIATGLMIRPIWMLLSCVAVRHKIGDSYTKLSLGKNVWVDWGRVAEWVSVLEYWAMTLVACRSLSQSEDDICLAHYLFGPLKDVQLMYITLYSQEWPWSETLIPHSLQLSSPLAFWLLAPQVKFLLRKTTSLTNPSSPVLEVNC